MELKVRITAAELIEGTAKRTGNEYKMVRVQGIMFLGEDTQIFRTILPKDSPVPSLGEYIADYQPRVNNATMELEGGIVGLVSSRPQVQQAAKPPVA